MLQASEYSMRDYLSWYHKTSDFSQVEVRKKFKKTKKSLLVLSIFWLIIVVIFSAFVFASFQNYYTTLFLIVFLLLPFFLPYTILIPLLLIKYSIQIPIEKYIIAKAKHILKNHKAIKIAVAGSYGKTSMREMLKTVLEQGKKVSAPPHSYNTPLGISTFINTLTGDEDVLIFEFGEYYPGDIKKLCDLVEPDFGVITGINQAHLQKFKSLEKTVKTIYELADYLGSKPLYVNGDSVLAKEYVRQGNIVYSNTGVEEWNVTGQETSLEGTAFVLENGQQSIRLSSSLLGLHQVGPLAVTVRIAMRLGLTTEQSVEGVRQTKPFAHRMEPSTNSDGVTIIDDSYNGNPDGVNVAINFLASLEGKRRFYITPGLVEMGSQTKDIHIEIGKQLASAKIEKVVLIKDSVTPYIEEGLHKAGYNGEIIWFDDALTALSSLRHITVAGDVVLLQNDWPDQYK
jgi:UDP-N-acetylmuramoyl-tripeptide--D-alanyl-D-alanine ligase